MLKRELPAEVPGDVFDRQRCLLGWDQPLVERQRALVLGCGAIGCSVALTLARLGVGALVLVDRDAVEPSNLNRQLLFAPADVGRPKADAAADTLRRSHVIGKTEVTAVNVDVRPGWRRVVELARASTVVFNAIDIGGQFDYAVLMLCRHLGIPCLSGSSFGRCWVVENFSGRKGESSFSIENREGDPEVFARLTPELVAQYETLDFVKSDANPPTRSIGSSVLVAGPAGIAAVSQWVYGLLGEQMPNYSKVNVARFWDASDLIAWPAPRSSDPQEAPK
eukprot:m51a1_g6793 hypothetical protein (279) ;mRNA; f:203124-204293